MKQVKNVNKCRSCGYYAEHYIKTAKGFEEVTGCGHCLCRNLNNAQSDKIIKRWLGCDFYIPKSEQIKKRQKGIEEILSLILNYLREISSILEFDRENF